MTKFLGKTFLNFLVFKSFNFINYISKKRKSQQNSYLFYQKLRKS